MESYFTHRQWDEAHKSNSNGTPSHLFTDENPATTIKGTGYKNRFIAQRTIKLTSQPGVRYKQYWTIRAVRERAAHCANQTKDMQDAIAVFDEWLTNYKEPTKEEKQAHQKEWETFHRLCKSDANKHAYGKDAGKEELSRARRDASDGQRLLFELLSNCKPISFPLTSFVAIFGCNALHGYGKHTIYTDTSTSHVEISGINGVEELLGNTKTKKLTLVSSCRIEIQYDRKKEVASVTIKQSGTTLKDLWRKGSSTISNNNKRKREEGEDATIDDNVNTKEPSWVCSSCTYIHIGHAKMQYLVCEVCNSKRNSTTTSCVDYS